MLVFFFFLVAACSVFISACDLVIILSHNPGSLINPISVVEEMQTGTLIAINEIVTQYLHRIVKRRVTSHDYLCISMSHFF